MLFLVVLMVLLLSLDGFHMPHRSLTARLDAFHAASTVDDSRNEMKNMLKTEIKEIVTQFLVQIIEKNVDIMSVVNPLTLGTSCHSFARLLSLTTNFSYR